MNEKIAVTLFDTYDHAAAVVSQLEMAGIAARDISVLQEDSAQSRYWDRTQSAGGVANRGAASSSPAGSTGAASPRATGISAGDTHASIAGWLESEGVDDEDADAYAEGVRRGGTLVVVRCNTGNADRVVKILDGEGVLDIDERQTNWRSEGWTGRERAAARQTASGTGSGTATAGKEQTIPIVEEELNVGKRQVGHGRIRIHSHVVEKPVREQVSLRQEHVEVERRPVDRPLTGKRDAGGDVFRDRTIEVDEKSEEAVVSKEARVKEELVVKKDVDQRTETVSDTVRRTEVDIEDERQSPQDTRRR